MVYWMHYRTILLGLSVDAVFLFLYGFGCVMALQRIYNIYIFFMYLFMWLWCACLKALISFPFPLMWSDRLGK